MGIMAIVGIKLDAVSLMELVMAVGLAFEYVAHIVSVLLLSRSTHSFEQFAFLFSLVDSCCKCGSIIHLLIISNLHIY